MFFRATLALIVAVLASGASAASPDSPAPASTDSALAAYADLVRETELRRRVNVLFPNPQSIFGGMQVGYVGVRRGNLTFLRRDIVAGNSRLAHFSRVYDSRRRQGRDFGPGWRLALAEELAVVDGGLVYTDGSGARHFFVLAAPDSRGLLEEPLSAEQVQLGADGGRVQSSPFPAWGTYTAYPATPQHASATIEVAGRLAILLNGETARVFERSLDGVADGNAYRLSSIASGAERLDLSYRNGRISKVSDTAGPVFGVTRDRFGRVVAVQDRWGGRFITATTRVACRKRGTSPEMSGVTNTRPWAG